MSNEIIQYLELLIEVIEEPEFGSINERVFYLSGIGEARLFVWLVETYKEAVEGKLTELVTPYLLQPEAISLVELDNLLETLRKCVEFYEQYSDENTFTIEDNIDLLVMSWKAYLDFNKRYKEATKEK